MDPMLSDQKHVPDILLAKYRAYEKRLIHDQLIKMKNVAIPLPPPHDKKVLKQFRADKQLKKQMRPAIGTYNLLQLRPTALNQLLGQ